MIRLKDRLAPLLRAATSILDLSRVEALLSRVTDLAGPLAAPLRKLLDLLRFGPTGPAQLTVGGPAPIVEEIHPEVRSSGSAGIADEQTRRHVSDLKKQLEESKLQLMGQTANLRNRIHDLEKRNAELLEKVVNLTQKERALAQKVVDTKFEGSGVAARRQQLEVDLRETKRRQSATARELDEAREAQASAQAQISETQRRLAGLEEELERARKRAAEADQSAANAQRAQTAAEANLRMSQDRAARLEAELRRARSGTGEPTVQNGPVKPVGDEMKGLQAAVSELQAAVKELRSVVTEDTDDQTLAPPAEKEENMKDGPESPA